MIGVTAKVTKNADTAEAFSRGIRRGLLDTAQAGFNTTQERIAAEATDTGQLLRSGFGPVVDEETWEVLWGYAADYAEWIDKGTDPHMPPVAALRGWARRVLGDADLAWAVAKKIAREGTEGIHFVKAGIDTMKGRFGTVGLKSYVVEEL